MFLTEGTLKKRILRTPELIADFKCPSPESKMLFADGWAMAVGSWYRDQLDIFQTERVINKKPFQVWTQGPCFSFSANQVIHDTPIAHTTQYWQDAVPFLNTTIKITAATPNSLIDTEKGKKFSEGFVHFDILTPEIINGVKSPKLVKISEHSLSQNNFVKGLKYGMDTVLNGTALYSNKKSPTLNKDGQPINRRLNAKSTADRNADELIGLCRGIIADRTVCQPEAEYLIHWLQRNPDTIDVWPGKIIADRVHQVLEDGHLDTEEATDLLDLLRDITGESYQNLIPTNMSTSCFDDPQPYITFEGKTFCLTGKFALGPRKACELEIIDLGGNLAKDITMTTDYLVIGSIGSTDWIHTSYGRKIEKAKELQANGLNISIISEDHWASFL